MRQIAMDEGRPFSYRDFLSFEYEGITYKFAHGTIRNYFSKLQRRRIIAHVYTSSQSFYSLIDEKTGKPMTPNHTGVNSQGSVIKGHTSMFQRCYFNDKQGNLYSSMLRLPMGEDTIHDIRLWFKVKGLWEVISMYSDYGYPIKKVDMKSNRDIMLTDLDFGDHVVKTTIHKTDSVSVTVACTSTPIAIDMMGLIKLSTSLARVEEKLQRVVDEYLRHNLRWYRRSSALIAKGPIPNYKRWFVTMWHFGQDSLTAYSGDLFMMSWKEALGVFQIYSKRDLLLPNKKKEVRVRMEVQEYPNRPWFQVFMERFEYINKNGHGFFFADFREYLGKGLA
jgi:hypothetical protein